MSPKSKRYNYHSILRQRIIVVALTLGLLAIMIGLGLELYLSTQRTTVPPGTARLLQPLDPLIDIETIEELEQMPFVPLNQARIRVSEAIEQGAALAVQEPEPDAVEEELLPEN